MSSEVREKNGVLGDAWKKRETCEEQLRRMVRDIADSITSPEEGETAAKWMEDTYDIRYYIDSSKCYMGAEILVAGGGPTIWVDTFREKVTGWWGTDPCTVVLPRQLRIKRLLRRDVWVLAPILSWPLDQGPSFKQQASSLSLT